MHQVVPVGFDHDERVAADGRPVASRLASFDEVLAMAELLRGSQAGAIQIIGNPNPPIPATDNYDTISRTSGRPVLWLGALQLYSQPDLWRHNLRAAEAHLASGSLARPMCTPRRSS